MNKVVQCKMNKSTMRLPIICLFLACMTITQAAEVKNTNHNRVKRDFLYDFLHANLGLIPTAPILKEDVKILRIPGFDQALLRLVPRVPAAAPISEKVVTVPAPISKTIVQMDPITLIGSYLGTKNAEETILAMENMKQLMHTGVMRATQEVIEVAPPVPPVYVMEPPIVEPKLPCPDPRPVYPIFGRTVSPVPQPCPLPAPIPVVPASAKLMPAAPKIVTSEEMRSVVLPAAYSYLPGYPSTSLAFVK